MPAIPSSLPLCLPVELSWVSSRGKSIHSAEGAADVKSMTGVSHALGNSDRQQALTMYAESEVPALERFDCHYRLT